MKDLLRILRIGMTKSRTDLLGQEVNIGDYVAYAPAGAYAGISIGLVEKFTPKNFGIKRLQNGEGRHMSFSDTLYYTTSVIKLDSKLVEKIL